MKIKKQHMILLGIIAVLLIYLLVGTGKNKMSYSIPKLENLDQNEITRIEITGKDRTVTLTGQEENWTIQPQKFPADTVKVQDMLETISGLSLTELAAEKEGYQRYDLDQDNRLNVKAFKAETLMREFDIGKTPSTYRHTFVRLADDTRVFYARESFRSRFDLEVKDLRDKSVMSFDKNEISEIAITQAGATMVFKKEMTKTKPEPDALPAPQKDAEASETEAAAPPQAEEAWVSSDGKTGLKDSFETILSALSDLRCDEFLENEDPMENQEPVFSITLKGTKEYTLRIFAKQEGDNGKYPALSSENGFPFLLATYGAERIIKKPKDLFPEELEN